MLATFAYRAHATAYAQDQVWTAKAERLWVRHRDRTRFYAFNGRLWLTWKDSSSTAADVDGASGEQSDAEGGDLGVR